MCFLKFHFIIAFAMFHFFGPCFFAAGKLVGDERSFKAGNETKMPNVQLVKLDGDYQKVQDKNSLAIIRTRRSYGYSRRKQSNDWSVPVVMPVAILLQILVPSIHAFIAIYKKKSACRVLSLHAFFSFICWLIYLTVCGASQCAAQGTVFGLLLVMSFIMIFISYLFMLIESCYSDEKEYITNIVPDISAIEFVNKMRDTDPKRVMLIECYHFETRTRTVTTTDAQGNTQTSLETYQEIVITHTESQDFPIEFTQDISDQHGLKFDQYSVTRLKLTPEIQYGDTETEEKFEEMRAKMIAENEHRDTLIQFTFKDSIDGFKERICAYTDPNNQPFWMNAVYYWVATVFGLTWIYRAIFLRKTAKCEYIIKKVIYFQTPPDSKVRSGQMNVQMPGGSDNPAYSRAETDTRADQQAQSQVSYPPYPTTTEYRSTAVDNCPASNNAANASLDHTSNQKQSYQPYPLATTSKPVRANVPTPGTVNGLTGANMQPHVRPAHPPAAYSQQYPLGKATSTQPMHPSVAYSPHAYGHSRPAVIYRPEGIRYLPHGNVAIAATSIQTTHPNQPQYIIPAGNNPVILHPPGPY